LSSRDSPAISVWQINRFNLKVLSPRSFVNFNFYMWY
jgi:hypothetical protein